MADNEDEDLFNDLYDDDNVAPPKPSQAVDDTAKADAAVAFEPDQYETSANFAQEATANMLEADDDNDVHITGDDSNGYGTSNAGNGAAAGTPQYNYEQEEQPIGIKEDG
ncbi:MAG: hypothetical protein Q9165_002259 [Trypethelium subeluteriae]